MAYNRRNNLKRIVEIQNLTLEYKKKGCTLKWIFDNIISSRYFISKGTYSKYLGINAKKELKLLNKWEGEIK